MVSREALAASCKTSPEEEKGLRQMTAGFQSLRGARRCEGVRASGSGEAPTGSLPGRARKSGFPRTGT